MTHAEARRFKDSQDPTVQAEARRVLDGRRRRAARVKPKKGRAPSMPKPERDETIRPRVMARAEAQGGCEWCPPHRKSLAFVLEWHHLRSGGERRTAETVENTAGVCWDCHRGWERGSMDVLRAAKEWAIRQGFRDALHRVERKIAKIEEARR